MKRTLLAVGIAVLISTLCVPCCGINTFGVPFFHEYCRCIIWGRFVSEFYSLSQLSQRTGYFTTALIKISLNRRTLYGSRRFVIESLNDREMLQLRTTRLS